MSDIDPISFGAPKSEADPAVPAPTPAATPTVLQGTRPGIWMPPTPEELQAQVPQYKVLDLLGRGGMGAVYKGWQTSLDRHVAIKILPPALDDGDVQFAARFKQEAKTMAKFQHPGIVSVIDAGETATGLLYFVMEFIEGTDVAQMLKEQGRLQPDHALSITAHVCDALAYAHEEGVIHRDIKPANVMLDTHGRVKVADFGLAKSTAAGAGGLTRTDMTMGTPDFIAPEALISGMLVDHRADVYAVGVMLYQMLTGKVPRGHFELPSRLSSGVDSRFDAIVLKAMKQEREQRYQSAREIRRDLDVILNTPAEIAETQPSQLQETIPVQKVAVKGLGRTEAGLSSPARSGNEPGLESPVSVTIHRPARVLITACTIAVLALGAFFAFKKPTPSSSRREEAQTSVPETSTDATTSKPSQSLVTSAATFDSATKDAPFVNTLGMKFVPVPILGGPTGGQRVLFSVWDTRVQDYEVFVKETKHAWPKEKVGFEQGPTHPAVNVSWDDAQVFCQWLTARELAEGKLGANERYRLPSDHEWSCAVEIGAREDGAKLPSEMSQKLADVFAWGSVWPPPKGAGNYAGEELQPTLATGTFSYVKGVIGGYSDGFVNTSPVGSFATNRYGLFDLSGNVWQWCEDWYDKDQKERVYRGGSWHASDRGILLSSYRGHGTPGGRAFVGFRCVLSAGSAR